MKKIRFALAGSGAIAPTHAQALARIAEAELVAVYSRSADKGQVLAEQFNCQFYADYHEMLSKGGIDAVAICTPSGTHAEFAVRAAQAGKHVLIEKPIEISLEGADAIISACKQNQVQLGVIFQRRFSPGVVKLKELLSQGRLGKINYAGCYAKLYRSQEYYDSGAWRGTWQLDGGGVLMNQGIHYVDLLQYLAGPVVEITARCATVGHERIEVEDAAAATVTFASGAIGVIEATTNAYPGLVSRIDLYGSEGSAIIENDDLVYISLKSGEQFSTSVEADQVGVSSPQVTDENHEQQFRQFIAALQNKETMNVSGSEVRKALEIILAMYKSAFWGQPVALPLTDSLFLRDLAAQSAKRKGFAMYAVHNKQ
jgi:predicted dehydrogenase